MKGRLDIKGNSIICSAIFCSFDYEIYFENYQNRGVGFAEFTTK